MPDRKARHRTPPQATLDEATATPTVSGAVPTTRAASVMVIDARSGKIFTKKMPTQCVRPRARRNYSPRSSSPNADFSTSSDGSDRSILSRSRRLNIKAGDTYQRIDLLRALLVKSPNDVARCLARDNAGSVEAFAEMMNRRARELGATNSHFVNPNGLPMPGQYSTARDLSLIARPPTPIRRFVRSSVCRSWFFVTRMAALANSKTRTNS